MNIFLLIACGILLWVLMDMITITRRSSGFSKSAMSDDFDSHEAWKKFDEMKEVWAKQSPEVLMEQRCYYHDRLCKAFYPEDRRFFLEVIGEIDNIRWAKMKEAMD